MLFEVRPPLRRTHPPNASGKECIRKIEEYAGTARDEAAHEAFTKSSLIQDAVIRNLQILAEFAGRISPEHQALSPEVPWQQVRGFRNILVHQYLGIDIDFIWGILVDDLPVLAENTLKLKSHIENP